MYYVYNIDHDVSLSNMINLLFVGPKELMVDQVKMKGLFNVQCFRI